MLMEVMIAMALAGILLTAILSLQMAVFRRVIFNAKRIERIISLRQLLVEKQMASLGAGSEKTSEQEGADLSVEYVKKPVSSASILHRFEGMMFETVVGTWQEWDGKKEIQSCQIVFVPIKPEKQEMPKKGKA